MRHFGIWLAVFVAALFVVLPASAAMPGLALAPDDAPACSSDTGPSGGADRLASEALADAEEEENERDGGDDDEVAPAYARGTAITGATVTERRHASHQFDADRGVGLGEHAPRGPPAIR